MMNSENLVADTRKMGDEKVSLKLLIIVARWISKATILELGLPRRANSDL